MSIGIGSTVYVFDENYRIYDKGNPEYPAPVYRKHFRPHRIVGETSRSWVLDDDTKVSKKTLDGIYVDDDAVDRACWVHFNRYKIVRYVQNCRDHDKLKAIAEIVGYQE